MLQFNTRRNKPILHNYLILFNGVFFLIINDNKLLMSNNRLKKKSKKIIAANVLHFRNFLLDNVAIPGIMLKVKGFTRFFI